MLNLPNIIAIEMSSYEDDAFPLAVCWSLSHGEMKFTLISPESEWLDRLYDQGGLDIDPQQLLDEGHSVKSVFEELQLDVGDEPLYCIDPHTTEQALSLMLDCLDREVDFNLLPVADLLIDTTPEERESCRQDCISMFDLNDHQAGDQIRLWMEILIRLKGDDFRTEEADQPSEVSADDESQTLGYDSADELNDY